MDVAIVMVKLIGGEAERLRAPHPCGCLQIHMHSCYI